MEARLALFRPGAGADRGAGGGRAGVHPVQWLGDPPRAERRILPGAGAADLHPHSADRRGGAALRAHPAGQPGGARPNEAEIPEHLRPLVQAVAEIPAVTPSPEQAIQLQIPAINVDAPIVLGDGWEQLKKGVGQHIGSANPGQDGNLVLSAHNDVFGQIFRHLEDLKRGDEVTVYTAQRAYVYVVTATLIVEPTEVDLIAPTPNATLTLISCYPYLVDNQRIVVQAVLQSGTR